MEIDLTFFQAWKSMEIGCFFRDGMESGMEISQENPQLKIILTVNVLKLESSKTNLPISSNNNFFLVWKIAFFGMEMVWKKYGISFSQKCGNPVIMYLYSICE